MQSLLEVTYSQPEGKGFSVNSIAAALLAIAEAWSRAVTNDHFSFEVTANLDEDGMKAVDAIGVKYVFQFARELPAEALGFIVGQQPQRRFQ